MLIPPLGITAVAEGLVRFAYLFFARERNDKEWFPVLAQTMNDHVIICGAGRVGFRVFEQLQKLAVPMVVIERDETKPFLSEIRAAGVAVLVEDVRAAGALTHANLQKARAIVCATGDDLANRSSIRRGSAASARATWSPCRRPSRRTRACVRS